MERLIHKVEPKADLKCFSKVEEAFQYISENKVDVALLDIEMGACSGIEFANMCKDICPQLNIIFVTGYSQYSLEALKLHASGYLLKPVREEDLREELDNLRYPINTSPASRVRIQTFGKFEVFVDGQPMKLPLTKCRECLAYLVDRKGALVTVPELASVLWEDRPLDESLRNYIYQIIFMLIKTLKDLEVDDIIIKYAREIAIDPSKFECDYYKALGGDTDQLDRFVGEYMNNYSWAEFTVGELVCLKQKQ